MSAGQLQSLFYERRKFFIFNALVNADAIQDSLFKYYALRKLLESDFPSQGFGKEQLVLLVEDFQAALPEPYMLNLILSMGIIEELDGRFFLKETASIEGMYSGNGRKFPKIFKEICVPVDDLRKWFVEDRLTPPMTVRKIRKAIMDGLGWLHWTLQEVECLDSKVKGLPAFWQCREGKDEPLGYLRAGTSNGDTLGALTESFFYDCSYDYCDVPDKGKTLSTAVRFVLDCQVTQSFQLEVPSFSLEQYAWNYGGFMAYDDQPKAFHPTVDATWDAVIALSSAYDLYDTLTKNYGPLEISREKLGRRIVMGVEFLLRMQLTAGGWGIYRYPDDLSPVFPYEFTTAFTIIALCLTKLGNVFSEQLRSHSLEAVDLALHRAFEFLKAKRQPYGPLLIWTPFYDSKPEDIAVSEILKCTAWSCSALLALYRQFEALRDDIRPMLKDFIDLADRNWIPSYGRRADVEFRVPFEDQLNDTFNSWKNRLDTTLVILLLDLHNEGKEAGEPTIALTENLWDRIEETVANVLHEQHPEHGHWSEPVDNQPLAAATLMALQVLHYYFKAMKGMLQE